MPELPEVENTVRWLRQQVVDEKIERVKVCWGNMLPGSSIRSFQRNLRSQKFVSVERRGKYIIGRLSSGRSLIMHLRMSGHLHIVEHRQLPHHHDRIIFELTSGRKLCFRDTRKFGRVYLVQDEQEIVGKLGPEPLTKGFTPEWIFQGTTKRKRAIKPLLLDQNFIAGLGNIYVDESLWYSGIYPERIASSLDFNEVKGLHVAIRSVLKRAINSKGTDFGDNVVPYGGYKPKIYGRTGEPCYKCNETIEKIVVAQRGTHYCPECQRSP